MWTVRGMGISIIFFIQGTLEEYYLIFKSELSVVHAP